MIMRGNMKISINNLSKIYNNGTKALENVNLEISSGMFGFLGPNGAGKTTLMQILVTLMQQTKGDVKVDNMDLKKTTKSKKLLHF